MAWIDKKMEGRYERKTVSHARNVLKSNGRYPASDYETVYQLCCIPSRYSNQLMSGKRECPPRRNTVYLV